MTDGYRRVSTGSRANRPRRGRRPELTSWQTRITQVRDLAGTLALLAVPTFALRAWIVGSFDFDVASALMLHTTPAQLVYVSLLFMTPVFLFVCGLLVARWLCRAAIQKGKHPLLVILIPYLSLPIFLIPALAGTERNDWHGAIFLLVSVPLLGTMDVTGQLIDRGYPKGLSILRPLMVGVAVVVASVFALYPRMWLPPERAVVSGEAKKVYILEHKDDEYVFFDPRARSVVRLPDKDLTDRQYCDENPDMDFLINLVVSKPKGRPTCP
ncbi:hypothetical protein ABZ570_09540 [Micromonospora sp. NPDC007271]|uniref:hypothetical protein n=1 Tax=Micromonospora sp. NPDC007271 TaxID=3154587 RepID=UPI0033D24D43